MKKTLLVLASILISCLISNNTCIEISANENLQKLTMATRYANKFSDGKAWVSGEEIGVRWLCINTKGEIQFTLESGLWPASDFVNGVAWVQEESMRGYDDKLRLLNENGEEILNLDGCNLEAEGDGLYFITKEVESFEGEWTEAGVIDTNGEWVVPLMKDITCFDEDYSYPICYCGDRVFGEFDGYNTLCFNIDTGDTFILAEPGGDCFSDGYTVTHAYAIGNVITDTTGTEKVIEFEELKSTYKYGKYREGMFFVEESGKFYDKDGNVKIDLSKYDIRKDFRKPLPYFTDEYAPIVFANDYFTLIDKEGNFVFEPQKANMASKISEGIVGYHNDGIWTYIDMEGNVLFECDYGESEFHDGYALFEGEEGFFFVDKWGEKLY